MKQQLLSYLNLITSKLTSVFTSAVAKFVSIGNYLASYVPTPLPRNLPQFETWTDSIIAMLGPELANVPLIQKRFVLATMIINLGSKTDKKSKRFFVQQMNKAASNQVASEIFRSTQEAEKAEKQQAAQPQAGATATPLAVAPRGQG